MRWVGRLIGLVVSCRSRRSSRVVLGRVGSVNPIGSDKVGLVTHTTALLHTVFASKVYHKVKEVSRTQVELGCHAQHCSNGWELPKTNLQ